MYDSKQIRLDCKLITTVLGRRVPYGFFTVSEYNYAELFIRYNYRDDPILKFKGRIQNLDLCSTDCELGIILLKLAMAAEEVRENRWFFGHKIAERDNTWRNLAH